jgi:hypothetical protein
MQDRAASGLTAGIDAIKTDLTAEVNAMKPDRGGQRYFLEASA